MLEKFDLLDARPVDTAMDPRTAKVLTTLPTEESTPQTVHKYQEIVGCLMWLLRTRPGIQFTAQLLSRFLQCATQAHIDIALGRPMKYLAGTVNYGIVYTPEQENGYYGGRLMQT